MREVAWVIYDEIHYMRDKERGVVWEESIILLPHTVRFVFLSATIPNSQCVPCVLLLVLPLSSVCACDYAHHHQSRSTTSFLKNKPTYVIP